ncbi:MAG: muramidase, partial [Bacilli bacterium]
VDANWGPDSIDLLTQPRSISGLKAVKQCNKLLITWNKSTDVDLLGYNLFANGFWIATLDKDDTNFEVNEKQLPFTVNGPITISIEAFDNDGEVSQIRSKVVV